MTNKIATGLVAIIMMVATSVTATAGHRWCPDHGWVHHNHYYRVYVRPVHRSFVVPLPIIMQQPTTIVRERVYRESPETMRRIDALEKHNRVQDQELYDQFRHNQKQDEELVRQREVDKRQNDEIKAFSGDVRALEQCFREGGPGCPSGTSDVSESSKGNITFGDLLRNARDDISAIPGWFAVLISALLAVALGWLAFGGKLRSKKPKPEPQPESEPTPSPEQTEPPSALKPEPAPESKKDELVVEPVQPTLAPEAPAQTSAKVGVREVEVTDREGKIHTVDFPIAPRTSDGSPRFINPLSDKLVGEDNLIKHAKAYLKEKYGVKF